MKKFISLLFAISAMPVSTVHAENIQPDYSLWDRFIKYDLRITDYDALSDEEKELCRFIFETERSSEDTIICERARRILAGYDVGERIPEKLGITYTEDTKDDENTYYKIADELENYYDIYDRGSEYWLPYLDENKDLIKQCSNYPILTAVPDIRHIDGDVDCNEYWFDDSGAEMILAHNTYYYQIKASNEKSSYNIKNPFVYEKYSNDGELIKHEYIDRNAGFLPVMEYENCTYQIYPDGTLTLCELTDKTLNSVTIPENIDGMDVVGIKSYAFDEVNATSIHLPETISFIEPLAFNNCQKLRDVNFPEGLDSLGDLAFYKCSSLGNIVIDCPNLKILSHAFYETSAESITFNVKTVSSSLMTEPDYYKSCVLGDRVREIGINFLILRDNIEIPENVKVISWEVIPQYTDELTVPENIEILGAYKEPRGKDTAVSIGAVEAQIPIIENKSMTELFDSTISGYYGTEAHNYALTYNTKFRPLDDILYGDANGDGKIGIADLVSLQNYLLKNSAVGYEADVNRDGRTDVFDIVTMRQNLIQK